MEVTVETWMWVGLGVSGALLFTLYTFVFGYSRAFLEERYSFELKYDDDGLASFFLWVAALLWPLFMPLVLGFHLGEPKEKKK